MNAPPTMNPGCSIASGTCLVSLHGHWHTHSDARAYRDAGVEHVGDLRRHGCWVDACCRAVTSHGAACLSLCNVAAHLSCGRPSAPAAAAHWRTSRLFVSRAACPPKQSRCSDLNALLSAPLALALVRRALHRLTCRCHLLPHQHLPRIQCQRARALQHFFENGRLCNTSRPRYGDASIHNC
jgi:hypothetical protein